MDDGTEISREMKTVPCVSHVHVHENQIVPLPLLTVFESVQKQNKFLKVHNEGREENKIFCA